MASNNIWDDSEITTGQRLIKDGSRFDTYLPRSDQKDTIVIKDGSVEDTVDMMKRVVWTYKADTKKLAEKLRGNTKMDTCRALWQFVYDFIQYKLDAPGLEQLRRPARSWDERTTGVDCDCMSIFCSAVLTNLHIPHSFRITKYSKDNWQHVYVIVPDGADYITVDGVLGRFNYEKPFSLNKDFEMNLSGINIAVLSGFDDDNGQAASDRIYNNAIMGTELPGAGNDLCGISDSELDAAMHKYLIHTREVAKANPMILVAAGDKNPAAFIEMIDYAIKHWHTPHRNAALGILIANEEEMNKLNGFDEPWMQGLDEDALRGDDDLFSTDYIGGLGKAKKAKKEKKGFFKKVVTKVKDHVVRMNPLTIAARNGFLLALKLNVGRINEKIKWGYATPEQAAAKRISPAVVQKAKGAIAKIEKLFVKLGGKSDNLRKAVLNSKKGKLSGLGYADIMYGLGEALGVAPLAAGIAAAVPVITAVLKILKDSGLVKPGEQQTIAPSEDDTPVLPQEEETTNVFDSEAPAALPAESMDEGVEGLGSVGVTIKNFFTNNPIVATAAAALAGLGLYSMFQSSDGGATRAKPSLSGTDSKKPIRFTMK